MDFLSGASTYIIAFLFVLTLVVFVHEWGHFIIARLNGVRVEVFSIGFGPEIAGFNDRHGTRWRLSAIPLGGYVKFFGDASAASTPDSGAVDHMTAAERAVSFHHKRVGQRAAVVAAGPVANFIFAILILAITAATFGHQYVPPVVGEVIPGSAADEAGIRAGDRIVSINGSTVERFDQIFQAVALSAETELEIGIERDGEVRLLAITPRRVTVDDGFGGTQRRGQLGIRSTAEREYRQYGPIEAIGVGVRDTWNVIDTTMTYLGRFVTGRESGEELGGPLRIAKMSGDVANISWAALILLAAQLSVSIGLVNLFPIPLLDGGHLLYYAVEAVRGRPLGERAQEYGFRFGLAVVLALFLFATWNDLVYLRVVPFLSKLFS
jgi:regulator of sigma E protease